MLSNAFNVSSIWDYVHVSHAESQETDVMYTYTSHPTGKWKDTQVLAGNLWMCDAEKLRWIEANWQNCCETNVNTTQDDDAEEIGVVGICTAAKKHASGSISD